MRKLFGFNKSDRDTGFSLAKFVEESDVNYFDRVVMAMVEQKEKEHLAEQPAILAKYIQDHKNQLMGHEFSCVRYGDFLSVFMKKLSNAIPPLNMPTHYSTTINLNLVSTINKIDGSAPNQEGETWYRLAIHNEDGTSPDILDKSINPMSPPPEGFIHAVEIEDRYDDYPWLFHVGPDGEYRSSGIYREVERYRSIAYTTPNTANPARQDAILFSGLDIKLYVPFGKGDEVHAAILQALEKGYNPKPLPTVEVKDSHLT
jgi:hypothetical protein